jgi:hypothetical protein
LRATLALALPVDRLTIAADSNKRVLDAAEIRKSTHFDQINCDPFR